MRDRTVDQLIAINRTFYSQFAGPFDRSRSNLQPGVTRLIGQISAGEMILDLGCGNGKLLLALREHGFSGHYIGLDFSAELVGLASARAEGDGGSEFILRDLSYPGWESGLESSFDRILAFAVCHHMPITLVEKLLTACRGRINKEGLLMMSNWQFLDSPRWRKRIQPWERAGVDPKEVGENDYLLDWRSGGSGCRYVHLYSENELTTLAEACGFRVKAGFRSDGKEGNLGLYQVWEPVDA